MITMQTTKLRVRPFARHGVICAWFPDAPDKVSAFESNSVAEVTKIMYERRIHRIMYERRIRRATL